MQTKITSRQNPLVVRLSKLSDKKHRDEEGLFRLDGVKLISEALMNGVLPEYVFVTDDMSASGFLKEIPDDRLYTVTEEVLAKLTDEKAPQGIAAFIRMDGVKNITFTDCPGGAMDHRVLLLSSIRDPGNVGTIIRSACAMGLDRVYLSADCADIFSPKTMRASMGMALRQKITVVGSDVRLVTALRRGGTKVFAAALRDGSARLGEFSLPERVCFVIGNEGHGLSDELIDACGGTVIIPMAPGCESLNAAMAAGIISWEMRRV